MVPSGSNSGSPPHMRGKVTRTDCVLTRDRITPAYAGKSSGSKIFRVLPWDHPRICGEKPSGQHGADFAAGITPAYAGKRNEISFRWNGRKDHPRICGKSSQLRRWPGVMRDHPRICGEKSALTNCLLFPLGSPPHMRGKAFLPTPAMVLSRITPAYAGKSKLSPNCIVVKRDHPRICGEKYSPLFSG